MINALNRKILFGVFSGWTAQILSMLIGLFTLPVFFRYLPKEELGIWMFFLGTNVFINLADFGFSPVLGRHLAFELGKGDRIGQKNDQGAAYFFSLSKHVSFATSIVLLFLMLTLGSIFIYSMHIRESLLLPSIIAWGLFSLAQFVTCQFKYLETTLNGHGEVGWQNIVQVVSQFLSLIGYFLVLYLQLGGIILLAFVFLCRSMIIASFNLLLVHRRIDEECIKKVPVTWKDAKPHLKPALDIFLISLGAFLILNTDQYFIVFFLGTDKLPDYAAAYRLVQIAYTFAATTSMMSIPFISRMSAAGSRESLHNLLMLNTTVGMMIQIAGAAMIAVFGDYLISFWIGSNHFVGWPVLWTFCIMLSLENHHVIFARFGINVRTEPSWGKISICAGILNLVLTFIGVQMFGLLGIAMATMITQMLTSNWYAVWKTLRIIQIRFRDYFVRSGVVWLASGGALVCVFIIIRQNVSIPIASIMMAVISTGIIYSGILLGYIRQFSR